VAILQLMIDFTSWGSFGENLAPSSLPKFPAFFVMPQNLQLLSAAYKLNHAA